MSSDAEVSPQINPLVVRDAPLKMRFPVQKILFQDLVGKMDIAMGLKRRITIK